MKKYRENEEIKAIWITWCVFYTDYFKIYMDFYQKNIFIAAKLFQKGRPSSVRAQNVT